MSDVAPFNAYLRALQRILSTGAATEHTYRPALQDLLEAVGDGVTAINEPRRIACGAPDYVVTHDGTPIGYVEARDLGTSQEFIAAVEQKLGLGFVIEGKR
jgi:hypothetical protein